MTFASGLTTGHQAGAHRLARYRSEFPIFRDRIYLNTCSLGALGERARNKVVEFVDLWQARGASAWYDVWWAALSELRGRYARVIGAAPEAIALAPSVSVALSVLAESLDYVRRPKVVVTSLDFPTGAYQWPAKRGRGIQLVVGEAPDPRSGDRRLVRPQEPVRLRAAVARVARGCSAFRAGHPIARRDLRPARGPRLHRGDRRACDPRRDRRAHRGPDRARSGHGPPAQGGRSGGGPLGDRHAPDGGPRGPGAPPCGGGDHCGCAARSRPSFPLLLQRAGRLCRSTRAARSAKPSLRTNDSSRSSPVSAARSRGPTPGGCSASWESSSKGSTRSRTCTTR